MSDLALKLRDRRGLTSLYALPSNISINFNHKLEVKTRNVGKSKQDVFRNEFALIRPIEAKDCSGSCSVDVIDSVRVTLSGNDPEHVKILWEDIKRNIDLALTESFCLNGMPLPLAGLDFVVADLSEDEPAA